MKAPGGGRPTVECFRRWRAEGMADFTYPQRNVRQARCRVCGGLLERGFGVRYVEFMADGYRGSDRYVCSPCESESRPRGGRR